MNRKQTMTELELVLEVNPGSLREEDQIRSLEHWDSLKLLEIIAFADERFHIELNADCLARCITISDILSLLESSPAARNLDALLL